MNQVIVITGASSGFGALSARALADAGHNVYAGMRNSTSRNADAVARLSCGSPGCSHSGDTEQFLDCFTEDGSVNDWGRVFRGRQAIREWSDREFTGVHVSLAVIEQSTSGDTTFITAQVGGSGFNGQSTFSFTTEANAIRTMRITA